MAEAILDEHTDLVSQVTLIPSSGGLHEVKFGDELIYSKKETGRHPTPKDVLPKISP